MVSNSSNNNIEIIHVFDDEKFVDSAISIFEDAIPNQSRYFVINPSNKKSFDFVKSKNVSSVPLNSSDDYKSFSELIQQSKDKVVFLHALNERKQKLVLTLNKSITKVWFVWGYDLYNHWKPLKYTIYEKDTLKFVNRNLSLTSFILNKMFYEYGLFKWFKFSKKIYQTSYYNAVNTIDVVAPVLPTEMEFIIPINPKVKFAPFAYVNLRQVVGDTIDTNMLNAQNILVGNSAAQTNNHIEVFKKLSKINIGRRKVIVPLSYGDRGDYLELVMRKGKELLGDNFHPITNFLSLEAYNQLVLSCGFAVFNHIRQQAVGNIIAMGYFGTKLLFNEKGVAYKYFKACGMKVFSIDELEDLSELNISEAEFLNNRKVLERMYSKENVRKKVEKLLAIVTEAQNNKLNA